MITVVSLPQIGTRDGFKELGKNLQQQLVADLAESARAKWIQLAQRRLNTTRRDYLAGIQEVVVGRGNATVALVGTLPNLIENGAKAYDMHDTLLGPGVKVVPRGQRGKHQKKDGSGFYRVIPFRHATPGTTGAVGQAMGSQYAHHSFDGGFRSSAGPKFGKGDAGLLGAHIYSAAKKLKPTTGMPGGPTKWGGRLPAGMAPKLKDHHHSDIYAGMVKNSKTYAKATQSSYTTFRTISTGSPGWLRPATIGAGLAQQVEGFIRTQAPRTISRYLARKLEGT